MKIIVLTSNVKKFNEIKTLCEKFNVETEMLPNFKLEIQSSSLENVAMYSAIHAYAVLNSPLIVEDAGLFIRALNWFPGVYSSYVFKTIGVKGILKVMRGEDDRYAFFKSAVALAFKGGVKVFTGMVEGEISREARGDKGFGFDPIFIPKGCSRTFAEMNINIKNMLSHRGKAIKKMLEWLSKNYNILYQQKA